MKKTITSIIISSLLILFTSCSFKDRTSAPVYENWKINFSDDKTFSSPEYDDSGWQTINAAELLTLKKGTHYFWLRKTVNVPSNLKNTNIWVGFQKTNCAVEVFANGVYVGARGHFPPNLNVKIEQNTDVFIPSNCITDGTINIALRIYAPGSTVKDLCPSLDNDTQGYFMNQIKNIFNQKIFLCIAVSKCLLYLCCDKSLRLH